ncbi:MAG: protease modulator HflC, partial [Moraxellaceae bacterium]|nr:protease modulator HflC [Moraxellaceae bacterium]
TVIPENNRGVLQRLGEVTRIGLPPGLYLRVPLLDRIQRIDMRTRISDIGRAEYLDAGNNGMRVDAWVVWRIRDLPRYYLGAGADAERAAALMMPSVQEALRRALAGMSRAEGARGLSAPVLERIAAESGAKVLAELGVEILEVRVRRIAHTAPVQEVVLHRMRVERESEAARLRNDAAVQADVIAARAARERDALLAEARRQAQAQKAAGAAEAATILAAAQRQDPAFFRFRDGLQRWRQGFGKPGDVLVLAPDSPLRAHLKPTANGKPSAPGRETKPQ